MKSYSLDYLLYFVIGIMVGVVITFSHESSKRHNSIAIDENSVEVYFTYPKSFRTIGFVTCESVLIELLNNAKKNIKVLAYNWTSIGIANAIAEAHKRGVEVKIILDKENKEKNTPAVFIANENSSELKIRSISGISHNKVIIIDEKIVCTGSYNFTKAANEKNDENLLIIRSPSIAKKYIECWNKIREHVHSITEPKPEIKRWNEKTMFSGLKNPLKDQQLKRQDQKPTSKTISNMLGIKNNHNSVKKNSKIISFSSVKKKINQKFDSKAKNITHAKTAAAQAN